MAIKLKKDVININDELNKELSIYGFQIEFNDDNKEEVKDKKIDKKDNKKTTKKK